MAKSFGDKGQNCLEIFWLSGRTRRRL